MSEADRDVLVKALGEIRRLKAENARLTQEAGHQPVAGYLASRLTGNLAKVPGFAVLALLNTLVWRTGATKQALVRGWRSCGYLYQISRSIFGRV